MGASRRRSRGFTLVEMLVAVVIAAIGMAAAMNVARTLIGQNAKGRQRTSFSSRSLLIGRQLRADLRIAGLGSSGAIAVDPGANRFGDISFQTPSGGVFAISAVMGANNIPGGSVGGFEVLPGSDAVQLLVPNPSTMERTYALAQVGAGILSVIDAPKFSRCPMIYVVDQSTPTGVGRAQIAFVSGTTATNVSIDGTLQFTVASGSQVMCARLSTYWLDTLGNFRRTDLSRNPAPRRLSATSVFVDESAVLAAAVTRSDVVTPGALDVQIAYRVSAEAYRLAGQPVPTGVEAQWGFKGGAAGSRADELLTGVTSNAAWLEVRMVRINVLARTLRKIEESDSARRYPRLEDGGQSASPFISVFWNHTAEWTTISEGLTNLRYFDFGASAGVPAEPF